MAATSADATGGYSTVPTVIGMRGDRRRHRVVKGAATTSERLSVAGLHDLVERLVYLPAVDLLVTCEKENGASVWDAADPSLRLVGRLPHGREKGHRNCAATVFDCGHVPERSLLVTVGVDRRLCAWDATAPFGAVASLQVPGGNSAQLCLAWEEAEGGVLYSGGTDGRVRLWDLRADDGRCAPLATKAPPGGHAAEAWVTQLITFGRARLLSGATDALIIEWDLRRRRTGLALEPRRVFHHHSKAVCALAFAAACHLLLSAAYEHDVFVWAPSLPERTQPSRLVGHSRAVAALCASATTAEALSCDVGGTVRVWDVRTLRCVQALEPPDRLAGLCRPLAYDGTRQRLLLLGGFLARLRAARCRRVGQHLLRHDRRGGVRGAPRAAAGGVGHLAHPDQRLHGGAARRAAAVLLGGGGDGARARPARAVRPRWRLRRLGARLVGGGSRRE